MYTYISSTLVEMLKYVFRVLKSEVGMILIYASGYRIIYYAYLCGSSNRAPALHDDP